MVAVHCTNHIFTAPIISNTIHSFICMNSVVVKIEPRLYQDSWVLRSQSDQDFIYQRKKLQKMKKIHLPSFFFFIFCNIFFYSVFFLIPVTYCNVAGYFQSCSTEQLFFLKLENNFPWNNIINWILPWTYNDLRNGRIFQVAVSVLGCVHLLPLLNKKKEMLIVHQQVDGFLKTNSKLEPSCQSFGPTCRTQWTTVSPLLLLLLYLIGLVLLVPSLYLFIRRHPTAETATDVPRELRTHFTSLIFTFPSVSLLARQSCISGRLTCGEIVFNRFVLRGEKKKWVWLFFLPCRKSCWGEYFNRSVWFFFILSPSSFNVGMNCSGSPWPLFAFFQSNWSVRFTLHAI